MVYLLNVCWCMCPRRKSKCILTPWIRTHNVFIWRYYRLRDVIVGQGWRRRGRFLQLPRVFEIQAVYKLVKSTVGHISFNFSYTRGLCVDFASSAHATNKCSGALSLAWRQLYERYHVIMFFSTLDVNSQVQTRPEVSINQQHAYIKYVETKGGTRPSAVRNQSSTTSRENQGQELVMHGFSGQRLITWLSNQVQYSTREEKEKREKFFEFIRW